jgi:diguanylate cyclase
VAAGEAERVALDLALRTSQAAKHKVDHVIDDLGATNEAVKRRLSAGRTSVPARKSLKDGERIETAVKEVGDDLIEVNGVLSEGIQQLETTETALADVQDVLAQTEDALADSQRKEDASRQRALHDALTGLPNRELFADHLAQAIAMAERHAWTLAVMFLDLDRFKPVNDEHGHAVGDAVLQEVARRLSRHSRDEDTVCRLGGDEFLVLLINPQGPGAEERIAQAIRKEIGEPIDVDGVSLSIATSIGIACFPEHATHGPQLVSHADAAMYRAKRLGAGVSMWSVGTSASARDRAPTAPPNPAR